MESGSQQTRRWRELDSNFPFRAQMGFGLRLPDVTEVPRAVASAAMPGHHDRICLILRWRETASELSVPFAGVAHVVLFSEIDAEDRNQCTTGQGVERIPAYPALFVKAIDRQQQRDLRSREFDPVLRAPLAQSRFLGLVRKIFPLVDGAPPH
jgi:hypothetical protein